MGHNRKYACQDRDPHECDDHRSGSDILCVIAKRCSASTSPIPDLAFVEQPEFDGLLGGNFFQLQIFALEILDFSGGPRSRRVVGQAPLAGFQPFLRPPVVEALGDALPSAQLGDRDFAMKGVETMRIFSSAKTWLRMARRLSRTRRPDGGSGGLDVCLVVHFAGGYDEPGTFRYSSR